MKFMLLNSDLEQIYILDDYESLIWTERFSECGDFEIYAMITPILIDTLNSNENLYLWGSEFNTLMVVEKYSIESQEDGTHIQITGRSLESILDRRVVLGKRELTGNIQDEIERLIDETIINPSNQKRKISNFIFKKSNDPRFDKIKIHYEVSDENLYDLIEKICKEHFIGFKIDITDTNDFVFSLYLGEDRSYDQTDNPYITFSSKLENLGTSNYAYSKEDYKNCVYVVNKDSLYEYDKEQKIGINRREMTTSMSSNSSVEYEGSKSLVDARIEEMFEGEVYAKDVFVYGKDFWIGDVIQIVNEYGINAKCRVIEMVVNQDSDSYEMYITFESV